VLAASAGKKTQHLTTMHGNYCFARTRWHNQLNPDVRKEPFSDWEDAVIVQVGFTQHTGEADDERYHLPNCQLNLIPTCTYFLQAHKVHGNKWAGKFLLRLNSCQRAGTGNYGYQDGV
jgi:hypothetical protein